MTGRCLSENEATWVLNAARYNASNVVRIHLQNEDLGHIRFGISPLGELVSGLRMALTTKSHPLHAAWTENARASLRKLDLSSLQSLMRPTGYLPDFLTPPPTAGTPSFSAELEHLVNTPAEQIRLEVADVMAESPSEILTDFIEKPREAVMRVADLLEQCWSLTLEPHWTRIRTLHEADIMPRATKLAMGDTAGVLDELHPITHFGNGVMELRRDVIPAPERLGALASEFELAGRGLLLVPSAFVWPWVSVSMILDDYWQPSLYYSPRGVANLWVEAPPPLNKMLALALGRQRAQVVLAVSSPKSTQEIAKRLKTTTANVSHHLGRLRGAGLVEVRREGRVMFYALSVRGKALLELFS
jgi:DNA-binding transcriptional ArsR family regulator